MIMEGEEKNRAKVRDAKDIGELLRRARKRQGLTQQELADLVGVGVRFVSEVERGKGSAEIDRVIDLLRGVGIDVFLQSRGHDL